MKQTLLSCLNRQMTTRLVLIALIFLGLGQIKSYAQNIYYYTNKSDGVPNYVDPNADDVLPNLSRGGGVSNMNLGCTGGTQGFGSTGWPTTNVFDVNVFNGAGDFVEFTLDPDPGFGLKITGFSTRSRRENVNGTANDGPNAMRYGYSINGGPWTTVNPGNPQSNNLCNSGGVMRAWPGGLTINTIFPVKFRIYGLSSGSSGQGDLFLRDVIVQGEVCDGITLDPIPSLCFANIEQSANMDYAAAVVGNQVEVNFVSPYISDLPLTTLMDPTGSFSFDVLSGTPVGVYLGTLTVSNSCGFEIDYPISVTVNALPDVSVSLSTSEICAGEEVTLTFEDLGATGHTFHLTADLVDDNGTSMGEIDYTGVADGASIVYTEGLDFDDDEFGTVSLVNILVVDETTACENTLSDLDLTVNPLPDVEITLDDLAICDNGSVTLTFTDLAASGHTFSITAVVDHDGPSFPISYSNVSSGATDTYTEGIDFEGSINGTVSLTNIVVTDDMTGCEITVTDLSITVNPLPNISAADKSICSGTATGLQVTNPNLAGGTFNWTATYNGATGGAGSATGVTYGMTAINETLVNPTNAAVVVQYRITPIGPAPTNYTGSFLDVSITVSPAPTFGFTASTNNNPAENGDNDPGTIAPNSISVDFCADDSLTLSGYSDNGAIGYTASYTTSGNILYAGVGPILDGGPTNISPLAAAGFFGAIYGSYGLSTGTFGTITQTFTPYLDVNNSGGFDAGDCEGVPMTLNYFIHAIPTVVATPSATAVCNGATVNIAFTGNYPSNEVTYAWTNDNLTVGLAQGSGTGNISFTATNNTNAPIVANLSVTPSTDYCEGETVYFTVTVYPEPVVSNITATVSGGSPQSANNVNGPNTMTLNFCSGQSFSFSLYNGTPGIGFIEEITAGTSNLRYGVTPIPVPRPQTNIAPGSAAAFFAGTYGPYNLAPGETYGWMSETFTPYFDANNNGSYNPMTDCLGDPITVIYKVYAPIVVNVARGAGEICSGDPVDYSITTTSSQNITFTLTFGENTNGNNPADLDDDNIFPAPVSVTINNLSAPHVVNQAINNAMGSFDRGRVSLSVSDVEYTDPSAPTCSVTINNPNPNTQVYPEPILTDPADVQITAGSMVNLNFDPLLGLPSSNTATAGFPVRIQWTTTTSPGVNVVGPNSGTALIYDQFGVLTLGNDISKTINLNNNTCNGTVTFTITPESDGPTLGGGFDAQFCTGQSFDVVVNVVKPITVEHVYTAGPVTCGDEFTVSVKVSNFCDVSTLDYPFTWDPNVFELVRFTPTMPQPLSGGTDSVFSNGPGELTFLFEDDGAAPFGNNLPNGTVIFTYTLRAIGDASPPNYNIPNALPLAKAFNSDFLSLPINNLGASIDIDAISLSLAGNPSVCPSDDIAHLYFTNATGNPTFYVIDFFGCPNFPDIQQETLNVQDGQIQIPLPDNLLSGSCSASLVISNNYGCESAPIPFSIIIDQVKPTASLLNPTLSQSCLPAPAPNAAVQVINRMDNCPGPINASWVSDVSNGGTGCGLNPRIITRTYQVTDQAGNISTLSLVQTITIVDNQPPTVSTTGLNACYSSQSAAVAAAIARANATKADNCTDTVGINVTLGTVTYNGCTASIRLIITDACGNVTAPAGSTYTTIIDNTDPFVFCPSGPVGGGLSLPDDCYPSVTAAEQAALEAVDPCDFCTAYEDLDINVSTVGSCSAAVTVTVADCAGNEASYTFNTRIDNAAPVMEVSQIPTCYLDTASALAAAIAGTNITDDCNSYKELTITATISGVCPAVVTVTATDQCGNSRSVSYPGLCVDIVIAPEANNQNVGCSNWQLALAAWLTNHGGASAPGMGNVWSYLPIDPQTVLEMSMPNCTTHTKSVVVTFRVTNSCGDFDETTATFSVTDNTPPTANLIPNTNLSCTNNIPAPDVNLVTGEADNCGGTPTVTLGSTSDNQASGCPNSPRIITRQYIVTDGYCNTAAVNHLITIVDNVPPTFVAPANTTINANQNCGYTATTAVTGDVLDEMDNCTPSGPGLQATFTDVVTNGTGFQNKFVITRTWRLSDACGNMAIPRVQTITVKDVTSPTLSGCPANYTLPGVIIELNCGALFGNSQANPVFNDNCPGSGITYQLSGITPGSGSGYVPAGKVLNEGVTTVTYTVTDAVGNTASCSFNVTVNCVSISGRLIWEHDKATGVKDGTVSLTPTAPLVTDLSDVMGVYDLVAPANGNYTITPVKNINRLNGVNAADAAAITAHVGNMVLITDPYKKVCADVNRSGNISNQDAFIITQCLAGNPTAQAAFSVFWRFVDKTFVWPAAGPNVVPPFPSNITVNVTGSDIVGKDFYGMKIGDVAPVWANPANAPGIAPLVWVLQDQTLVAGTEIELTFAASNFNNLSSYQFALDFDPTQMQFVAFQPLDALQLNLLNNFGAYNADLGELRHVWSSGVGTTLADGTQVFRAKFKVLASGQKLSDVLRIDDSQIECKAFSGISAAADVKVAFAQSVGTDSPIDPNHLQLQLKQNRPNPFTDATTIGFILPEACDAHIRILDISGLELTSYDRKYTAGYHELDFKMENAWTYGVLFCELVTPQGTRVIKMVTTK